jgi:hypothetical protein
MTMAEDDGIDNIFKRMVKDMDIDPAHMGVVNFSVLQDQELLKRFTEIKTELYSRGEMINPKTDTGRDLSAQYHACLYELKKRRIL